MLRGIFLCIFVWTVIAVTLVDSRYLPTRSQDDRLGRLRELLKDLLEVDSLDSLEDKSSVFEEDPSSGQMFLQRNSASPLTPSRSQHLIRTM